MTHQQILIPGWRARGRGRRLLRLAVRVARVLRDDRHPHLLVLLLPRPLRRVGARGRRHGQARTARGQVLVRGSLAW